MIRACAFSQAVASDSDVILQCEYTLYPQHTVTLQWFKIVGTSHVPLWTADSSGHNATVSSSYDIFLESDYPLSKGHEIRMYVIPSDQDLYYCTISYRTSLDGDYKVSSNIIQIAKTGSNIILKNV